MTFEPGKPLTQQCQEMKEKYSSESNGLRLLIEQSIKALPIDQETMEKEP